MRPDAQQLFPLRRAPSPRLRPVPSAFAHSNRSPRGAPATFSRPPSRGGAKKAHWAWVAMRGSRWEYFDRPARHAYVHLGPGLLTRPRVVVAGEGEVVFDADTLHLPFGVSQCCSGSSCSAGRSISAKAPARLSGSSLKSRRVKSVSSMRSGRLISSRLRSAGGQPH